MGVVGVQFLLDGVALGAEVMSAPYQVSWNTTLATNAAHALTAIARDAAGNRTTSAAISVTVSNVVGDTTPPSVSITAPANGATISAATTISAAASDNVGVVGVTFFADGVQILGEVMSAPYQVVWNTAAVPSGIHRLTASARDAAGNVANSAAVVVTVTGTPSVTPDTTPPVVAITAPAGGATVSGAVTISATATDNVAVAGVQFFVDGAPVGDEKTTAPYAASWDTTAYPSGSHTLTAVARDSSGNRATSAAITVTIAVTPPQPPPNPGPRSPFKGSPIQVPGRIEAEDFDNGGEGVAYHDTTLGNQGGTYRLNESVDIISPYPLGFAVTDFQTGEWLEYTINVTQSGVYRIEALISSIDNNGRFHIEIDRNDVTGVISVPNTGWWDNFRWIGKSEVNLTAGTHVLRVQVDAQYFNFDALALSLQRGGRDRVVRH